MKNIATTILIIFCLMAACGGSVYALDLPTTSVPNLPTAIPTTMPTQVPVEVIQKAGEEVAQVIPEDTSVILSYDVPQEFIPQVVDDAQVPQEFAAPAVAFEGTSIDYGDFIFIDKQVTSTSCDFYILKALGKDTIITRIYKLTYNRTDYLVGKKVFITGTYTEQYSSKDGEKNASGIVEGSLSVLPEYEDGTLPLLMLTHIEKTYSGIVVDPSLYYTYLFLDIRDFLDINLLLPTATPSIVPTLTPVPTITPNADDNMALPFGGGEEAGSYSTSSNGQEDHHHDDDSSSSSRSDSSKNLSHKAVSSSAMQVAVGALAASLAIALSGLPSAVSGASVGTFSAVVQSAQSAASSVASNTAQAARSLNGGKGTSGKISLSFDSIKQFIKDIAKIVWEFIKELLLNLRDMLTDEGRSYASGKVSDMLDTDGGDE